MSALRVALVAGPMYDHLYRIFEPGEVEVVVHADHPTLNRTVAAMLAGGERIDVLATHSKYAPSQAAWLLDLDELLDPEVGRALAPAAVDLCRYRGIQWCLPRLIDVRVLWWRRDRLPEPPERWSDLLAGSAVFGFTGRESGAFGTFFELVAAEGGRLFDDDLRPCFDSEPARQALRTMQTLADRAPADLPDWHYDDVDRALLEGRVDLAAAWPGAWGALRSSALADLLVPSRYPAGTARRVSYSGCHAWAVPRTCGDVPGAVALVERLLGAEAQAIDAAGGSVCAHRAAFAAVIPSSDTDARRLEITRRTIEESMITYPPLRRFPEVEDAGWSMIQEVLRHRATPEGALERMQHAAELVLDDPSADPEGHHR